MFKKIRILFNRAGQIFDEQGFLVLLKRSVTFLRYYLVSYSINNIYWSSLDPPDVTCEINDLSLEIITHPKEINQLESDQLIPEGFDILRDKELLNTGAILYCAFVGKELAHIAQVAMTPKSHAMELFSFSAPFGQWTSIMGVSTAVKYRRRGLNVYVRTKVLQYLKEQGFSKAWDLPNENDLPTVLKLGFNLWGTGHRLRLVSLLIIEWTRPESNILPNKIRCRFR